MESFLGSWKVEAGPNGIGKIHTFVIDGGKLYWLASNGMKVMGTINGGDAVFRYNGGSTKFALMSDGRMMEQKGNTMWTFKKL
jgi:hypothetical protein